MNEALTNVAAWVGATTGILSLGWAVISHFLSGARLSVTANRSIDSVETDTSGSELKKEPYISVTIANVGRTPVMFRSAIVVPLPSLVQKWRRRYRKPASVVYKTLDPYVGLCSEKLMPGDMISGKVPVKDLEEYRESLSEKNKVRAFCLLVLDSMSRNEKLVKIDESNPMPGVLINRVQGTEKSA